MQLFTIMVPLPPPSTELRSFLTLYYGAYPPFAGLRYAVAGSGDKHPLSAADVTQNMITPEYLLKNATLSQANCHCIGIPPTSDPNQRLNAPLDMDLNLARRRRKLSVGHVAVTLHGSPMIDSAKSFVGSGPGNQGSRKIARRVIDEVGRRDGEQLVVGVRHTAAVGIGRGLTGGVLPFQAGLGMAGRAKALCKVDAMAGRDRSDAVSCYFPKGVSDENLEELSAGCYQSGWRGCGGSLADRFLARWGHGRPEQL